MSPLHTNLHAHTFDFNLQANIYKCIKYNDLNLFNRIFKNI